MVGFLRFVVSISGHNGEVNVHWRRLPCIIHLFGIRWWTIGLDKFDGVRFWPPILGHNDCQFVSKQLFRLTLMALNIPIFLDWSTLHILSNKKVFKTPLQSIVQWPWKEIPDLSCIYLTQNNCVRRSSWITSLDHVDFQTNRAHEILSQLLYPRNMQKKIARRLMPDHHPHECPVPQPPCIAKCILKSVWKWHGHFVYLKVTMCLQECGTTTIAAADARFTIEKPI